MSDSLKNRAELLVREFWETYAARGTNALSDCASMISEDFIGHGTEILENWFDKKAILNQIDNEIRLIPDPISISFKSIQSTVSGNTVVTMSDLFMMITAGNKIIEFNPLRLLMTVQEQNSELKILGLSASLYDNVIPSESPVRSLDEPRQYEEVTVLFSDFQKFTNLVGTIPPKKLVQELSDIFSEFDDIIQQNGLHKVKTIGDAYMAVGGLSPEDKEHAIDGVNAAVAMNEFIRLRNLNSALKWDLRVGLHTGTVVGGMVGTRGVTFDIFGDTVNIANRIEAAGEPGKINISAYTYDLIKESFKCEYRGKIGAKGKGEMDMYWVVI